MLDLVDRVKVIEDLLENPSKEKYVYAALECRLTIEHLCYERFKLLNPYLGDSDLKNWTPASVVRQVSEEIDNKITQEIKLGFSLQTPNVEGQPTAADFEALEFIEVGEQSELELKKLHKLWQALSNLALHLPVPTISHGELAIYGNSEKIEKKVLECVEYFKSIKGNLIIGGLIGEVHSFNCLICGMEIRRPLETLTEPSHVHCINPKCAESYLLALDEDGDMSFTRQTIDFDCKCGEKIQVPLTQFYDMTLKHTLNVGCGICGGNTEVIMRPLSKYSAEGT